MTSPDLTRRRFARVCAAGAFAAGAAFLFEVHRLLRLSYGTQSRDTLMTMRLFHLSILYLTVVFAAVAVGVFIR